jgi:MFS family permease
MTPIAPPSAPALSRLGVLVLLAGPFLAGLDFFIVNVALPSIQRTLAATAGELELVVAGYGTAYAVLLVLGGRLGDEYGRRRMYAWGIAAFTVTSLLAGFAPTVPMLLAARVLQGAASAFLAPQTLATFQSVLTGSARGRAVATYAAAGGLASVVGQLIGGVLVSTLGWRAIFLVNVPVGIATLLLLRRAVPATRSERRVGVDVRGTVLLGFAVVALLAPLAEGPSTGWPWWTWCSFGLAVALGARFVRWSVVAERRGRVPLLPPSLVAGARSMRRGLPVLVLFFAVFGAFMFVFAIAGQDGLGLSPLLAGVAITPVCVAYFVTSFRVPGLVTRHGRRVLGAGLVLEAASTLGLVGIVSAWWSGLRDGVPAVVVLALVCLVVLGIGQSLGVGSLFRLVLSEVPPASAGVGGGVLVTTQQIALSLGVAGLGSVFSGIAGASTLGADAMRDGVVVIGLVMVVITAVLVPWSGRLPLG